MTEASEGLVLAPFRALRPAVDGDRLARLLCPPYDVIDDAQRARLLDSDPDNAVGLILPRTEDGSDPYGAAARALDDAVARGLYAVDPLPMLYVYEMSDGAGASTRGLLGAVGLRDPEAGVILPHENTMAGPVSDRLALMSATETNLEPIYLVYDGGGPASDAVRTVEGRTPLAQTTTPDGITHRLWAIEDAEQRAAIDADLRPRRALIADGHHRYATYRELQRTLDSERGAGPWDRGLTLLVDSSQYGPQVHAIHRVLPGIDLDTAIGALGADVSVRDMNGSAEALAAADDVRAFAAVLTDGDRTVLLVDDAGALVAAARRDGEPAALAELDVTVLHRGLVEAAWTLEDTVDNVGYAHSVDEAVEAARSAGGTAVLLRPTPVAAVAAVAAAGARMPRKSTLFTPKPASGLVLRRFVDET